MKALQHIELYKIPTDRFVNAVHQISEDGDLGERLYRERIGEMGNFPDQTKILPELLPLVYGYMIQEAVRNPALDGRALFDYAVDCAKKFIAANRYVLARDVVSGSGTAGGSPLTKRQQAEDLVQKHKGDKLNRQQWMALLIEHAGMTKGSASSYYATLKHKHNL